MRFFGGSYDDDIFILKYNQTSSSSIKSLIFQNIFFNIKRCFEQYSSHMKYIIINPLKYDCHEE